MNQGGIKVDDQRVGGRGQPGWVPWPGRSPDFGAQAAGHGGEPVGEGFWLVLDASHEPADRRIGRYASEEIWCDAQLVDVCGLLAASSKGQGQRTKDLSWPVRRGGWHELAEPVFAELAEVQGVQEAGQHRQPSMGDEGLAGELGRAGRENVGRMVH